MSISNELHPLLARAIIFLESEDWGSADDYCERYLDGDPYNAYAYVIKLMARVHVAREEDLVNSVSSFRDWNAYKNAVKFADAELKARLESYAFSIEERIRIEAEEEERAIEEANKARMYTVACGCEMVGTVKELRKAAQMYEKLAGYRDSGERAVNCLENAARIEAEDKAARIREEEINRKRKRENNIIRAVVVCVFIVIVIIVFVAIAGDNARRAEKIKNNFAGMSFSADFIESKETSSGGALTVVTKMVEKDITYSFLDDGSINVFTTEYYDETFIIVNGERQWDDIETYSETIYDYDVRVSLLGEVSILIDGEWCPVTVNRADIPESFRIGNITYEEN